jgi:hypothetical protein
MFTRERSSEGKPCPAPDMGNGEQTPPSLQLERSLSLGKLQRDRPSGDQPSLRKRESQTARRRRRASLPTRVNPRSPHYRTAAHDQQ